MSSGATTQTTSPVPDSTDRRAELEPAVAEECGVFGVWAPGEEVSRLTYFGLYALQHRGQEAAGIATTYHPPAVTPSTAPGRPMLS